MNILISGGAGYIGSHVCVELLNRNHSIVIADNLINSRIEVIERIRDISETEFDFHQIDVTDALAVGSLFSMYDFDGVIHLAGYKSIEESICKPLDYYYNNVMSTIVLAQASVSNRVDKFVFSSSATVYGQKESPIPEIVDVLETTSPYGETKVISERILSDLNDANPGLSVSLLRYFNPIGAHSSGLIGDFSDETPSNLMPYIVQVAMGNLEILKIFGGDYPTPDGTGIRDYIHVVDLAKGHVAAIEQTIPGTHIYNLGTGRGTSVLQLVNAFERVNKINVPWQIVERRMGDTAICYADPRKAESDLKWKASLTIDDMVRDAWNFSQSSTNK